MKLVAVHAVAVHALDVTQPSVRGKVRIHNEHFLEPEVTKEFQSWYVEWEMKYGVNYRLLTLESTHTQEAVLKLYHQYQELSGPSVRSEPASGGASDSPQGRALSSLCAYTPAAGPNEEGLESTINLVREVASWGRKT